MKPVNVFVFSVLPIKPRFLFNNRQTSLMLMQYRSVHSFTFTNKAPLKRKNTAITPTRCTENKLSDLIECVDYGINQLADFPTF